MFVAESFHPVLGGGEQQVRTLATALAAGGWPCAVLTRRSQADWPAEEWLDGVRIVRVGPSGPARAGKYAMVPAVVAGLWRERSSYDLAVVRGTRVLGLPVLLAARALGKRVVLQCEISGEMSGEVYTWGTRWHRPVVRRVVSKLARLRNRLFADADALVAISAHTRAEFLAAGLPAERVIALPHGVDCERFRPADGVERAALRERLGLPRAGPLLTFTGRLLRGKGVEVLLEAFAALASDAGAAQLAIVGSGSGQALSVEDELRQSVRRLGLESRVTFTGRVENVPDYLRASDAFVFPSFFEAMPLSVIEALGCGLAVVATPVGGIVDLIEAGRTGLLVPPGDAPALARAIGRVSGDERLRSDLGRSARAVALARFDARENVARYRTLFAEAFGGLPRRAAAGATA
jgi:glycosyltransferase involved in cell wall biosynthesis